MKQIFANNFSTLQLGRQGENLARQIVFDLSDWISGYGGGVAELIYQRPVDSAPYPVAADRDGDTLVWTLTATDTDCQINYGRCELRYYVGETLAKSKTWRTWVEPAMATPSETAPPEPEQGWVEQVLATGVAAQQAAAAAKDAQKGAEAAQDRAETAAIKQPYPNKDTNTWWVWDTSTGAYIDSGEKANGKDGKSAYQSAQDGGYTGTEQAFNEALADVPGHITAKDNPHGVTAEQVGAASKEYVDSKLAKKITAPHYAIVGQTIRVKTVDYAGRPTEWEAVDVSMPPMSKFNLYEIDTDGCFLRNVLGRWCLVPGEIKSLEDSYKHSEAWEAYNSYKAQLQQISENLSALQSNLEAAQAELEVLREELLNRYYEGEITYEEIEDLVAISSEQEAVTRAQEALDAETEHYNLVREERDNAYAVYERTSYARDVFDGEMYKPFLLPHVTAADNGKTLQVVDGKWALV